MKLNNILLFTCFGLGQASICALAAADLAKGNPDFFEPAESHCYSADTISKGLFSYPVLIAVRKKEDGSCPSLQDLQSSTFVCQTASWGHFAGGGDGAVDLQTKRGLKIKTFEPQGQDPSQLVTPKLGDNLICIQN